MVGLVSVLTPATLLQSVMSAAPVAPSVFSQGVYPLALTYTKPVEAPNS